jgi:hypothetical protein
VLFINTPEHYFVIYFGIVLRFHVVYAIFESHQLLVNTKQFKIIECKEACIMMKSEFKRGGRGQWGMDKK